MKSSAFLICFLVRRARCSLSLEPFGLPRGLVALVPAAARAHGLREEAAEAADVALRGLVAALDDVGLVAQEAPHAARGPSLLARGRRERVEVRVAVLT